MQQEKLLGTGDYLLVVLTIGTFILSLIPVLSGSVFITIDPQQMALLFYILTPIATMMAGVIFTYSIAQYMLQKKFRNLVLVFFAVNMIIVTIFYFLTSVSMSPISPFADRVRNRTIVAAFALVLAPSILFTGVADKIDLTRKRMVAAILWGGLLSPFVSFWFMFSPEPVFQTVIPGVGITPAAYLILIIIIPLWIIASWRYYTAWKLERNRLDLAALLSIIMWAYAVALFVMQTDPLQFIEIIWYSVFMSGEFMLTVVTVSTQIIEPQKELSKLVDVKTEELLESKKEIEFYLNIWGHKIGNLLQSMMLYLEMVSSGSKEQDEIIKLANTGLDIGTEANQINRQVAALIRLKEQEDYEHTPVNLSEMLHIALGKTDALFGPDCIKEVFTVPDDIYVLGDDFVELVLENLLSFACKHTPNPRLILSHRMDNESITLTLSFEEPQISHDVIDSLFSKLQPTRTTLSLDLFTVKILMQRFEGTFQYNWLDDLNKNQFDIRFRRVPIKDSSSVWSSKSTQTPDV